MYVNSILSSGPCVLKWAGKILAPMKIEGRGFLHARDYQVHTMLPLECN